MKKYSYLKQSQKLLLAAMTIPLAVSVLPITENVNANEVPTLNVYEVNGSPKLEWATEILEENVIQKIDFENSTISSNNLGWYEFSNDAYEGNTSLKVNKTNNSTNPLEVYSGAATFFDFNKTFKLNNDDNLSVSLKVKNLNNSASLLTFQAMGMLVDKPPTYSSLAGKPITFKEKVEVNQNYFYVNDINSFKELMTQKNYVVMNLPALDGQYDIGKILSFDETTGKVTIEHRFLQSFEAGSEIHYGLWTNPVLFNNRILESNQWTNLNLNTKVQNDNFNFDTRSVIFEILAKTNGSYLVDDIVVGYATEVEVYRDKQSIYKGYLSDFHDTSVRDTVKPNKVTTINSSITNNFDVNFNIAKPQDNGSKVNYQIQSIAKNGTKGALSAPQEIEIKTDVVKYKYSISNQETGTPTMETKSLNDLSIALKSINLETDYLHIQAIDKNGNTSEVESFQLKDLINMQELYDKIKQLEDSNNYNDFIDFIDEIEQLYGDNLPQDVKEMIDKLGKHHGVNTSFLLLEEGDFRLSTVDINSFGHTKLTAKKQTLTTAFKGDFGVIDARGTQEGWNVTVSATPFTVETFDGFVGTPHQLPLGSLALNNINHVEQVGTVHNSQLPTITLNQLTAIDGENQTVNLLNASKQKGMGEFKFAFGEDALSLTVDAVTAKIDTVNYPDKNTPYASTVTWNLVSGPQI